MWEQTGSPMSFLENGNRGNKIMHWLDPTYICKPKKLHTQLVCGGSFSVVSLFCNVAHDLKPEEYRQGFKVETPLPKTFWYKISEDGEHLDERNLYYRIKEIMKVNGIPTESDEGKSTYAALIYKMAPKTAINIHKDWVRKTVVLFPFLNCEESSLHIHETEDGPPINSIPFVENETLLFDNSTIWHSGENRTDKERYCFCISFFDHDYEFLKERLDYVHHARS
jgi:hypothetical protein